MPIWTNFDDARQARLLHELDAHDRVLVEEPTRVLAVGADAPDDGGEVDDDVRPAIRQRAADPVRGPQVVVPAPGHEDVPGARGLEPAHHGAAEESAAARHHDPATGPDVAHDGVAC